MLKYYTYILLFFFAISVSAQKKLEKIVDATDIEEIVVHGDGIYNIKIATKKVAEITLKATITGETFENLIITQKRELNKLTFGLAYAPFFVPANDKLAAHKVFSVEIEMVIPENKEVVVMSDLASLSASGIFNHLSVSLKNGNCSIHKFLGKGVFHTLKGHITIEALPQVSGEAVSETGKVVNHLRKQLQKDISVQSKHGNIYLYQTEY